MAALCWCVLKHYKMVKEQQDINTRQLHSIDRANQPNHNLVVVYYDLDVVLDGNQLQLLVQTVSGHASVGEARIQRVDREGYL